tara:strand:+ start:611 stop:865 length:255 start_codon:yes stop_codon:yes gene_type:complete
MKIKANQTIEVEITEEEKKKIAVAFLCEKFDWRRSYSIESVGGEHLVYNTKINHSSHSWEEKVFVREATHDDFHTALIFRKLFS